MLSHTLSALSVHVSKQQECNNEILTYCEQMALRNLNSLNQQYNQFIVQETTARAALKKLLVAEIQKGGVVHSKVLQGQAMLKKALGAMRKERIVVEEKNTIQLNLCRQGIGTNVDDIKQAMKKLVALERSVKERVAEQDVRRKQETKQALYDREMYCKEVCESIQLLQKNDVDRKLFFCWGEGGGRCCVEAAVVAMVGLVVAGGGPGVRSNI